MDFLLEQKKKWNTERTILLDLGERVRYLNDGTWYYTIDIFKEVIDYRYFTPIDMVINSKIHKGEGLFIIQNQAILIEIFASFKAGKIFKKRTDSGFFYFDNRKLYVDFLRQTPIFSNVIKELDIYFRKGTDIDNSYLDFYWDVRCGLIHEGILKTGWDVNTSKNSNEADVQFIKIESGIRVIYRSILQKVLKQYFNIYIDLLKNSEDNNVRINFARRLDCHFNITDQYFYW